MSTMPTRASFMRSALLMPALRRQGGEIEYMPARVLLQDFTGVPVFVDLAVMREAARDLGADPRALIRKFRSIW